MVDASRAMSTPGLRVYPIPNWNGGNNPYYRYFYDGLARQGTEVVLGGDPNAFTPADDIPWLLAHPQEADWAHLHFVIYYYDAGRRSVLARRTVAFVRDLRRMRARGLRLLWTCHNLLPHESHSRAVDIAVRIALSRFADVTVVHSADAARKLRRWFGHTGPLVTTLMGNFSGFYPDPPSRAEARAALGLPAEGVVLLFFGYLRPYKGVDALIRAFRQLPDRDVSLVVAGGYISQAFRDEVVGIAAGDPRVRLFLGVVPDADVSRYFAAADLVALPFRRILTSASLMLALSQGVPVIVPATRALSDYINDDVASVLPPDEPLERGLAAAVAAVRSGRLQAGERVRAWASTFTWEATTAPVAAAMRAARLPARPPGALAR
jgi:glycosyltransferase involved in cell wall biosynthesis